MGVREEFSGFPVARLIKNVMTSFDNGAENFLQITGTDIYNGYPKLKPAFGFWSDSVF